MKNSALIGITTLRKIKKTENDAEIVANLIQKSFSGFPWYEVLSKEECFNRIKKDFQRKEFFGFLLFVEKNPVAANWVDQISINQIMEQRGEKLASFAQNLGLSSIWWGRDLVVHPDYQRKGFGTQIRNHVLQNLKLTNSGEYIFTRMRHDNLGSIKICERLGYAKTEILVPSSQIVGLFHEYYYLKL